MATTEVILIENVVGLGAESDHVRVASGYARNFLIPHRKAIPLTMANKKRLDSLRKRRAEREAHEYNSMSDLGKSLEKLVCVIKVKTGDDGKLFGSVTSGTIADELKHQFDISLDKRKIHLDHPIRILGEYELEMRLHTQVPCTLKVKVVSTNPAPKAEEATPKPEEEGDKKRERRKSTPAKAGKPQKTAKNS